MKIVFLNGDILEKIYMFQHDDCTVPSQESEVCKFKKSLQALKQAPQSGMQI